MTLLLLCLTSECGRNVHRTFSKVGETCMNRYSSILNAFRGGSRTSTAGGTSDQWSLRLHWGAKRRKGEGGGGVTPSRRLGFGGLPRKFFEKLHQNGAFWVHFEVINARFFVLKIYMKKMRLTKFTYRLFIFFFKILRNGAFWAHIN